MWSCPYCGNHTGMPFEDNQLKGMICLHPACGRFNSLQASDDENLEDSDFR